MHPSRIVIAPSMYGGHCGQQWELIEDSDYKIYPADFFSRNIFSFVETEVSRRNNPSLFLQSAWLFVHFHAEKDFRAASPLIKKIPSNNLAFSYFFNGLLTFWRGKRAQKHVYFARKHTCEMGNGVLNALRLGWQNEAFIPFVFASWNMSAI